MQAYSDPTRKDDPYALPDIEVFYIDEDELSEWQDEGLDLSVGWYWWSCFPDCIPDSDPIGPFDTEAEALRDAQDIY